MDGIPSPDEAAAIAAAIERFSAETAPAADGDGPAIAPWQRAALVEGVSVRGSMHNLEGEGGAKWLS